MCHNMVWFSRLTPIAEAVKRHPTESLWMILDSLDRNALLPRGRTEQLRRFRGSPTVLLREPVRSRHNLVLRLMNAVCAHIKSLTIIALILSAQLIYGSPTELSPLPTPTTAIQNQSRTVLKHRKRPFLYSPILATVPNIIALNQQLPVGVKNASVRRQNVQISPIESNVYTVDGDLWRVKMEDNDDGIIWRLARAATSNREPNHCRNSARSAYRYASQTTLAASPYIYFQTKNDARFQAAHSDSSHWIRVFDGHHWTKKKKSAWQ